MNEKAKYYIDKLKLKKHPEGGYYNEIYSAGEIIEADVLPVRYEGARVFSTSIFFLLEGEQISSLHKLKSDEIWHFYDGSTINIYIISSNGKLEKRTLGRNLENDELIQTVIEKNNWFGADLNDKSSYGLIGCTVAPGFDFDDFEIGKREELLKKFPDQKDIILNITKP
ncbi:MAG TPA: cupin domain-containing protein [Ignavibacteriaceae bacterium]|nr:cupin domain-containing protein [Ignavibacteriaceae bacterium]